jgi:hypothetical protein
MQCSEGYSEIATCFPSTFGNRDGVTHLTGFPSAAPYHHSADRHRHSPMTGGIRNIELAWDRGWSSAFLRRHGAAASLGQIAPPSRSHQCWVQSSGSGHSVTGTGE